MAIQELVRGRRQSGTTIERQYLLTGYASETAARAALLEAMPATLGGWALSPKDCAVEEPDPGIHVGTSVWKGPDAQQQEPPQQPDNFTISFDISGVTTKITQAKKHIADWAPSGKTPRNFKGAINVTSEGVEGTDIITAQLTHTVTYTFRDAAVTPEFIQALAKAVGTTNDDAWQGYAQCELLLTRVSGQRRRLETPTSGPPIYGWDITFGFTVSKTAIDMKISGADGDIIFTKMGWHYLWVYYEMRTNGSGENKATHPVAVSAHVEQVYDESSYDELGIT